MLKNWQKKKKSRLFGSWQMSLNSFFDMKRRGSRYYIERNRIVWGVLALSYTASLKKVLKSLLQTSETKLSFAGDI